MPPLELDGLRQAALERATLALGRLDSVGLLLPNPQLFLYAYVRREALERFIQGETGDLPVLLKAALTHVQFETIHPFLDGNGRLGRLLIALLLHDSGALAQPLLYVDAGQAGHRPRTHRSST